MQGRFSEAIKRAISAIIYQEMLKKLQKLDMRSTIIQTTRNMVIT